MSLAVKLHCSAAFLLLACAALLGCTETTVPSEPAAEVSLAGDWRAVLASPGGELPFTLRLEEGADGLKATILNGEEEAPFSSVERQGDQIVLHFDWYDSEITARLEGEDRLVGQWRKTAPEKDSTLGFVAERRGDGARFVSAKSADAAASESAPESIAGHWTVEFSDEDGSEPARGEFEQQGDRVTGTFLTPTGDYRFLEGSYQQGLLRLSTFDGAHAFLFQARGQADGSLAGDFWSRDTYHATWTAQPVAEDQATLPDGWQQVGLTNDEGSFNFRFQDLDGNEVSLTDERFAGKAVLVNIFGSWCPNCNDEAPLLAEWDRGYRDQGLEIVGLAYEFTGDVERDRQQVRRFANRYGIEYPLLLAGTSDKKDAGATLPDLTAVLSYPTSVFIGRDGKVRKIYSGFAGPGTGEHHDRLVAEMKGLIESLLAEDAA